MEVRRANHCVYNTHYHIVFSVKYRKGLLTKGILYAPNYIVNAGGLINVASEVTSYDPEKVRLKIEEISQTLMAIFQKAEAIHIPMNEAADRMAEEGIESKRNKDLYFLIVSFPCDNEEKDVE